MRLFNKRLNSPFQSIAKIDIDSGARVSLPFLSHRFHRRLQPRITLIYADKCKDNLRNPRDPCNPWLFEISEQRGMPLLVDERFGAGFAFFHDELVESGVDRQGIISVETG